MMSLIFGGFCLIAMIQLGEDKAESFRIWQCDREAVVCKDRPLEHRIHATRALFDKDFFFVSPKTRGEPTTWWAQ